ncbi:MAG: glycoside hydrolase [Akkermansiaceae bacterium]|nr:glycoside hydrolase [Akkermansiaceae bacterium]
MTRHSEIACHVPLSMKSGFPLVLSFLLLGPAMAAGIPFVDLAAEVDHQVVVDREDGQYLGHVTSCLLDDGRTILAVYPKGHGRGAIIYKRSSDGGKTWSERLPTPASWMTSEEVPTLHRMTGPDGTRRIILWSGLRPARFSVSEDEGGSWSELKAAGEWGGIVVMGAHIELKTGKGHYACFFHDDGRFAKAGGPAEPGVMCLYMTTTKDGGLSWSDPRTIWKASEIHLCEPGAIRSPDGKTIALLLRENRRVKNSHVVFSKDEGATWTKPRALPITLTGDRHTAKYAADGRLVIVFRGITPGKRELFSSGEAKGPLPTAGDCAAWVGRWEDLVAGRAGEMVLRLLDNKMGYDTTYPGVERLPDGNFVVTTYGHWEKGEEPFIKSTRFTLEELDVKAMTAPMIGHSGDAMTVAGGRAPTDAGFRR